MEKINGSFLMIIGVIIFVIGLLGTFLPKGGFPRLPGDILIQRDNFTFYFPLVSSILLSIILTILLSLFFRR